MIIPIHRKVVPLDLKTPLPSCLYKYAYRIQHNKPLKWGLFKERRNKKRAVEYNAAWKEVTKYLKAAYSLPPNSKIWLHCKWHRHGANFCFSCEEE